MEGQPKVLTKEQMTARLGISVDVFQAEIDNSEKRLPVQSLNRVMRRAMTKKRKH